MTYCRDTGWLIVRMVVAGIFLYHGIMKIGAGPEMMNFIGSAPHQIGLTFLSTTVWFYIALVAELLGAVLILLGAWTRVGAVLLLIVMLFAMNMKKWGWPMIELDLVLALLNVAIFVAGPGRYALCHTRHVKEEWRD